MHTPAHLKSAYFRLQGMVLPYTLPMLYRKSRVARAARLKRPFPGAMPGIDQKMWLSPENYFTYFYLSRQVFEPGVITFLKSCIQPGMTVYDIGANVGYLSLFCARLTGPTGRVIAFEPGVRAYRHLLDNVRLNNLSNIVSVGTALSDHDGEGLYCAALHERDDVYNSLDSIKLPWAAAENFFPRQIQVNRLDTLIAKESWPAPDVIKIDVEGAEHKVIAGMSQVLRANRPLAMVLECSKLLCEKFGYTTGQFLKKLTGFGFHLGCIQDTGELGEIDLEDEAWPGGRIAAIR